MGQKLSLNHLQTLCVLLFYDIYVVRMKQGKTCPLRLGEAPDPEQLVKSISINFVKTVTRPCEWEN